MTGAGAYAGDGVQFGFVVADLAPLAMVGDGKAVAFVADLLHQVQDGGAAVKDDGVRLVAGDVDNFFFFCYGRERLESDADLFEGGVGGMELA